MKLETINIKGKEYVPVNERLKYFRKKYPLFSLNIEVIEKTENSILIKATISDESERIVSSGIAEEFKNSTFINKTSYVENCETSACGRALANFGIGLDTSVSSAEEVTNAINNQSKTMLTDYQFNAVLEGTKTQAETVLKKWDATPEQLRKIKDKFNI
mgnify:FL=1